MICLIRASSTTFIPISGSTTARRASRIASSVARRWGSNPDASAAWGASGADALAEVAVCVGVSVVVSVMRDSRCVERAYHPSARRSFGGLGASGGRCLGADDDARLPVLGRQTGRLGLGVARTGERAVLLEEVGIAVAMLAGVGVGGGDPEDTELRMVLEDPSQVVAVRAQLQKLANRQPGPVAEWLAVHHERVLLDPLDRHVRRPCTATGGAGCAFGRHRRGGGATCTSRWRRRALPKPGAARRARGRTAAQPGSPRKG